MASATSHHESPTPPRGWTWFGLDRLDAFSASHGSARTVAVMEILMRLAESPLDSYPGRPVPDARSQLFRYVIEGRIRVDFLVTEPIVMGGLKLIAVTMLS